jgi:LmbE family N-acetylglucosaminyl deacetylase
VNIVCIGAHPDDCEFHAGGTCSKWARIGHRVLLVSLTNGDIGHYESGGMPLVRRRTAEAKRAAKIAGCEAAVLDYHDGELQPSLALRRDVVRLIRQWQADLVLCHRPNDYHPDHRYASLAVQDAAFMVTVPGFCPDTPRLEHNPVFVYMHDRFQRPVPFRCDIAVDVDDAMTAKWDMLDAMESQVYEWLPWLHGKRAKVPKDRLARKQWLIKSWDGLFRAPAEKARKELTAWYGATHAKKVRYAELFEICEYGYQPTRDEIAKIFPFFPAKRR